MSCSSRAWPTVSWIASGAASTIVFTALSRSSMPPRKAPSLKKPWSTATSKHLPVFAKSRFMRAFRKPILFLLQRLDFLLDGLDLLDAGEHLEFEVVFLTLAGGDHGQSTFLAERFPRQGIDVPGLRADGVEPLAHHLPLGEA